MEDKTLTTEAIEPDVNVENEQVDENAQVEQSTTEAYDEAWDNVDINDTSLFDEEHQESVDNTEPETTSEAIEAEASAAFMASSPILKFKGKDIPIDNPEELINLAQKGFKMETEMANIKPQKKVLQTVSDVPIEILQAVADLHNGKQEAFDYLRERYEIKEGTNDDFFEEGKEDKPTSYTPDIKVETSIETFWNEYSANNVQNAGRVSEVYASLEPSFQAEVYNDKMFPSFVESVVTDEFDNVYPLAIKEKSLNPAVSWIQAYAAAAQKVGTTEEARNEPPVSAAPPAPESDPSTRSISDAEAAARVWEDDDYFNEMDRQISQI